MDKGYGLSATDLSGKTNDELNTLFVNARIAKFRAEAPLYWDVDDTLFFMNNVEFNAGTDERAKNTYPYSFGTETSRFRWRVDDADTRFDTTNRGLPNKEYSVETHDTDETGASIWNGETNNFFNLMELAFPEEKVASMRRMMTAMQALGGLKSGMTWKRFTLSTRSISLTRHRSISRQIHTMPMPDIVTKTGNWLIVPEFIRTTRTRSRSRLATTIKRSSDGSRNVSCI